MSWGEITEATNISLCLFIELVEFCLKNSIFRFRDKFYEQQFGTAMGSPLSPILADIVMNTLLSNVMRQLPFVVPVLRKFVDDLIIALPADQIDSTLNIFNSYNSHLQFTKEEEEGGRLPFLDMVVVRNPDQTLSTEWYAKPISSGRLLNYFSFHPTDMKINVAINLIHRVSNLTNNQTLKQQKKTVSDVLRLNDYPTRLINRLLNRMNMTQTAVQTGDSNEQLPGTSLHISGRRPSNNIQDPQPAAAESPPTGQSPNDDVAPTSNSLDQPAHTITEEPAARPLNEPSNSETAATSTNIQVQPGETVIYRSLPYVPVLTPHLRKILKEEFPNVKIASKTVNTTAKILGNNKDPVDPLQQSNVIYQLPCGGCPMKYIGMTRNYLQKRLYGHQSDINGYNVLVNSGITDTQRHKEEGGHTALIEHIVRNNHMFDLSKVKIIDKTYRSANLPILEMCQISNTTNTVNRRTDTDNLSIAYAGILHTLRNHRTHNNSNTRTENTDNTNTTLDNSSYNNEPNER